MHVVNHGFNAVQTRTDALCWRPDSAPDADEMEAEVIRAFDAVKLFELRARTAPASAAR